MEYIHRITALVNHTFKELRETLVLLFAIPNLAMAQGTMSLQQCIDYAQQHSIDIRKRSLEIEQQRNKVNTAEHAWLPTVTSAFEEDVCPHYSTSNGLVNTSGLTDNVPLSSSVISVNANMPLYNAGRLKNQEEKEHFTLEALTAQMDNARKDLRIQVAYNYMKVLYNEGLADVSRKQVEIGQELLNKATILVNEGKRPKSEVATATSQLAAYQSQYEKDKGNILLSRVTLAQIINMENVEELRVADAELQNASVPDNGVIAAPQKIYTSIVDSYPSILAANANIKAAEYNTKAMKSYFFPEISLFASLGTNYYYTTNSDIQSQLMKFGKQIWTNFGPVVGIKLSYTIFNGFSTRNNLRNARLAETDARLDLDNERMKLRQQLQQAYYNAVTAVNTYKASIKSEEACRIDYDYQQKSYDAGRSTIFQLDEVRQKWVKAQNDAVLAKYEYLIRMKILDFYRN